MHGKINYEPAKRPIPFQVALSRKGLQHVTGILSCPLPDPYEGGAKVLSLISRGEVCPSAKNALSLVHANVGKTKGNWKCASGTGCQGKC